MGKRGNKKHVGVYLFRKGHHEKLLGKFTKLSLNSFDDMRNFINKIESILWVEID